MAEELKTETVGLDQNKLDNLINDAFRRGAINGNKELSEKLEQSNKTIEELNNKMLQQAEDLAFEKISSQYDVAKSQYVRPELQEAMKSENFNLETFMNEFKEREPSFFRGGIKQTARVDSSSNNQQAPDFTSKVKGARTMAEIYALQRELK
jgi:hypothetical protein